MIGQEEAISPFRGAVFSNELFDALPAQPWRWDGEYWSREVLTSEGSAWMPGDPGEAAAWFASQAEDGLQAGDGATWCEGLAPLVHQLSTHLEKGLFLAIDYGEDAARLLAKGADLRRYKGHTVDGRWWEEPGACDLTADLDFTRLAHLLEGQGFQKAAPVTLSRWIREHAPLAQWEAQWQSLATRERMKLMENLLQLTLPGMMGERFRVLEAWK
jgi:NADH dehydrogenase [ubiquinone] 1 alpha subcomplex assembly factor 7